MHSVDFIQDLAVVMMVAGLVTITFHALKLPVVLGYLLAGVLIGPHTLPFPLITDQANIRTLSGLGVVFLLFALGLEFNFRKIRQLGVTAFIVAPLETALMFFAGYQTGQVFGWSRTDSLYLGGILMISSTTIITKTIADLKKGGEKFASVIYGILIAEDIIAILLIASLSGVKELSGGLAVGSVLETIGRLGIFLVMVVVLGLLGLPKLLALVGRFKSEETLLVTVLGLCFGLAMLAVKLGYSVALGAFITGALIAESHDIRRIERLITPLRDMFSAVFFVAIGLLIDPRLLWEYALPVGVICVILVGGKILACSFGCFVAGYDRETSLRVGLGLAQIGEFSFIIAALGDSLKVTSHFLYPIAVSVSAITSVLTPFLIQHAHRAITLHDRLLPRSLIQYQQDYTAWVARLRQGRMTSGPRRMVRRMFWQMSLNLILVLGVFLLALVPEHFNIGWLQRLPAWTGGTRTVLWLGAVLLSLPLVIATLRKLGALSMLVSEMAVRGRPNLKNRLATRALIANTTLFTGIIVLGLFLLVLSSLLLPSWKVFVVLLGLAILVAVLLKTFFIRIYSQAQASIQETLSREPLPPPSEKESRLRSLLDDAELITVSLAEDSPARGLQIRELELRRRTGATAIAIRRGTETVVSPEPDFEFREGDQVLLVGNTTQLQAAEKLLGTKVPV